VRSLLIPVSVLLLSTTLAAAASDDLDARLDELRQLAYARAWDDVQQRILDLQPEMADATARQRARFAILRARMAAIDNDTERAAALLRPLLENRAALDPDIELRALSLSANMLVLTGQFERGFDDFRQALALAPVIDAPDVRAIVYNVAADFHARIGEHATAIEYADRAMAQLDREQGLRTHCIALERRGRARLGLDQVEAAADDYRRAVERCQRVPDQLFTGISLVGLARAQRRLGRPEQAEATLAASLERLAASGFTAGRLEAHTAMGRLLLDQGRDAEAEDVMTPTWDWIEQPGNMALRRDALSVHARLAERRGDSARAYALARRAMNLRRQQTQRMRQMRLMLVMSDLDDETRQREMELLRSRNQADTLNRRSREQEELALTYAGSGAVLAGALLFVLLLKTARDRRTFRQLSQRDGLTGLLNHTRFFERAQQAFARARQSAVPFTLIVADVDLFKRVNDEYGHLVGDAVLARIGARLRSAFGDDAILGRLGGEEFGIALPECDIETAVARIEHLRAILNRRREDDREPSVTMSFGVAELAREPTLDVLYAHADQALYDAKDSGRNRVITVARLDLGAGGFVT
jgi:diguanylate cyclase (GGDEF)-like protein